MKDDLTCLTDAELTSSLKTIVGKQRHDLVAILRRLGEVDRRRLASEIGYPSLFEYCVRELRYGQGEAARRVHAARAAAKYRVIYRLLERGSISLSTISLLAPHLRWANYRRLLRECAGRSKREVEAVIAAIVPAPAPAERIRFVSGSPAPAASASDSSGDLFERAAVSGFVAPRADADSVQSPPIAGDSPLNSGSIEPPKKDEEKPDALAAAPAPLRVHFSFTADAAVLREFERVRELSRHRWPAGRAEDVFAAALRALLDKIDPERRAARARRLSLMRRRVRRVPAWVAAAVWRRDGGRCVFRCAEGRVCGSRERLELDHVVPFALGGRSDDPDNLRLLCRTHNALEARRVFGDAAIAAAIRAAGGPKSHSAKAESRLAPTGEI